jgi:hypothetical protein
MHPLPHLGTPGLPGTDPPPGVHTRAAGFSLEHLMTGKEVRQRLRAALEGVDGSTSAVEKLVFELMDRLHNAEARLEGAQRELALVRQRTAQAEAEAGDWKTAVESWKAKAEGAMAEKQRLRLGLEAETAMPSVSLAAVRAGFKDFCQNYPTEDLDSLNRSLRRRIAAVLGDVEDSLRGVSDAHLQVLLHLGFSEFRLCRSLTGYADQYQFRVDP